MSWSIGEIIALLAAIGGLLGPLIGWLLSQRGTRIVKHVWTYIAKRMSSFRRRNNVASDQSTSDPEGSYYELEG